MAKNNFGKIINCIAFFGFAIIAFVLMLQNFQFSGVIVEALRVIGESIAYIVTAISAFFYVRSKRNVWWYVAYAVAVVLVAVFMILRII